MLEAADAASAKNRTVKGWDGKVSLCDLGYCSVGVDEGWEGCGAGINATQHDAKGTPTIDAAFPDTGKMVSEIQSKNLSAGWYLNGCKCGERTEHEKNYAGDIRSLHDFGFDGVKIDGCGAQKNQTLYAEVRRRRRNSMRVSLRVVCVRVVAFVFAACHVCLQQFVRPFPYKTLFFSYSPCSLLPAHARERTQLHDRKLPLGRLHGRRRLFVPDKGLVPMELVPHVPGH